MININDARVPVDNSVVSACFNLVDFWELFQKFMWQCFTNVLTTCC